MNFIIVSMVVVAAFFTLGPDTTAVAAAEADSGKEAAVVKTAAFPAGPLDAKQSAAVERLVLKAFEKEWLDRERSQNRDFAAMRSADDDVKSTGTLSFPDSHFQIVTDANGISVHLHYQRGRGVKAVLKTDSFSIELTAPLQLAGMSLPKGTRLTRAKGANWSIAGSVSDRREPAAETVGKQEGIAARRTRTDSTGKYTVKAKFVDLNDGKVRLKKEDGKIVAIPIEKLSKEDQEFVKSSVNTKPGEPDDTTDPVEKYIKMAASTRDGCHTVNALMFNPKDPRLQYKHKERSLPAPSSKEVFAKLGPIDSFKYLSTGPAPTKQTDQTKAQMLMDKSLVGTGYWKDTQGSEGETCLFF